MLKRAVLLGGVALVGIGGQASAATTVGETFAPDENDRCYSGQAGITLLQTVSPSNQYRLNDSGVITSWSYRAGSLPVSEMQLSLAGPLESGGYTVVLQSEIEAPDANTLNTFNTRIPIDSPGYILGFWAITPPGGAGCWTGRPGYMMIGAAGHDPETFVPDIQPTQLDVSAVLEPDADSDGFGDESQDTCLPPTVQTDCDPPQSTITKAPPKKSAKRKARYRFTSDEPRSTFECRLNKRKFKTCESPFRKRVKAGKKHRFKVRATDGGGNVDPSPAKHKFRVIG